MDITHHPVRRRTVIAGTAAGTSAAALGLGGPLQAAQAKTGRARDVHCLDVDWQFLQDDPVGAQSPDLDDSGWTTVSVPHTFNDVDSFDDYITSGGEAAVAMQAVWYRKRITLPASAAGSKVFLEFEGIRQAATVYVDGTEVGLFDNGVNPFGFDISDHVSYGTETLVAVRADNTQTIYEASSGVRHQWQSRDFNPTYGGLTRSVWLHVTGRTYFTLPLYANLGTTGTYVHAADFDLDAGAATVTVESQVANEAATARDLHLVAWIVGPDGKTVEKMKSRKTTVDAGATATLTVSEVVTGLQFWAPGDPHLYTVRLFLTEDDVVIDTDTITTGFRQTEFRGGAESGGVYVNGVYRYLTGYAIRATNEWAAIGGAVPEWLRDHDGALMRGSNANLVRWMHIATCPSNIRMTDAHGIVSVQPAGDKEADVTGRQWEQRVEVMRNTIIYFRNSPSILFWEAGNNWITPAHMQEMTDLRRTWDPHGGRVMGCRAIDDGYYGGTACVDAAEYVGTMLNRHYSVYARDRMPIIECEYTRDEAPRRVWDDFSPPDFDYVRGPSTTYDLTSEQFAGPHAAQTRYEFWSQRIQGPAAASARRYSGSAALVWADSNQHGRQYGWECARLSGRVDALRLPKESLHTYRAMQSDTPDVHLIGHWTYPAGTVKTMYAMASVGTHQVDLVVNGTVVATSTTPTYDTLHTFTGVAFVAGTVEAVARDASGAETARHGHTTTGEAVALKLTVTTAPDGMRADGSDVALVDVEAVDAAGRRMPTHQETVDVAVSGPGTFLGSFNSHLPGSVHQSFFQTECGINRAVVRATRTAGTITVTATCDGLAPATTTITTTAFTVTDGIAEQGPALLPSRQVTL